MMISGYGLVFCVIWQLGFGPWATPLLCTIFLSLLGDWPRARHSLDVPYPDCFALCAGIRYGKRNKWNFIKEVCPYDSRASGICGCSDVYDEKIERESNTSRAFNVKVAALCGYSLRLWMFPTEGVNGKSSIIDWSYRGQLREQATKSLMHLVAQELRTLRNKGNIRSNVSP
jgi:hypothetical protein